MAGRDAAPAGSCTRQGHSGGIGAPPGTITSPRQELTDGSAARGCATGRTKAGPAVGKTPQMSRRGDGIFVALPLRYLSACWRAECARRGP